MYNDSFFNLYCDLSKLNGNVITIFIDYISSASILRHMAPTDKDINNKKLRPEDITAGRELQSQISGL